MNVANELQEIISPLQNPADLLSIAIDCLDLMNQTPTLVHTSDFSANAGTERSCNTYCVFKPAAEAVISRSAPGECSSGHIAPSSASFSLLYCRGEAWPRSKRVFREGSNDVFVNSFRKFSTLSLVVPENSFRKLALEIPTPCWLCSSRDRSLTRCPRSSLLACVSYHRCPISDLCAAATRNTYLSFAIMQPLLYPVRVPPSLHPRTVHSRHHVEVGTHRQPDVLIGSSTMCSLPLATVSSHGTQSTTLIQSVWPQLPSQGLQGHSC